MFFYQKGHVLGPDVVCVKITIDFWKSLQHPYDSDLINAENFAKNMKLDQRIC